MSYSTNTGLPIKDVVVPTVTEVINLFEDLRNSGKVFRVDFQKKSTGDMRTMVCRCGVKSHASGKGASYSFKDKGLLPVYEYGTGYRSIPIDNIHGIKHRGVLYVFNINAAPGHIDPIKLKDLNEKGTVPAFTSPLYG